MKTDQHRIVAAQFGSQAKGYVDSPIHAAGLDLDWIEDNLRGAKDAIVLDLGCGGGHVGYRAAPHVRQVVACDLSENMIAAVVAEAARRSIDNLVVKQAPAEALPFGDESFDFVLCRFSAHHWGDLQAGLREAARVLRVGGRALFVDAMSPGLPLLDTHLQAIEVLRDPSHVRDYSLAEWSSALVRAGLMPSDMRTGKLRLEFSSWTERMKTPDTVSVAVRYLQSRLPDTARRHFGVEEDGSFMLDTIWMDAVKA